MKILVYWTSEAIDLETEDRIPAFEIIISGKEVIFKLHEDSALSFIESIKEARFYSHNLKEFVTFSENPVEWARGFVDRGGNMLYMMKIIRD